MPSDEAKLLRVAVAEIEKSLGSQKETFAPMTGGIRTEGELHRSLLAMDIEILEHPMHVEYIHFLHRLLMMGIAEPGQCGVFRKRSVSVGNYDIVFSPAQCCTANNVRILSQFYDRKLIQQRARPDPERSDIIT